MVTLNILSLSLKCGLCGYRTNYFPLYQCCYKYERQINKDSVVQYWPLVVPLTTRPTG